MICNCSILTISQYWVHAFEKHIWKIPSSRTKGFFSAIYKSYFTHTNSHPYIQTGIQTLQIYTHRYYESIFSPNIFLVQQQAFMICGLRHQFKCSCFEKAAKGRLRLSCVFRKCCWCLSAQHSQAVLSEGTANPAAFQFILWDSSCKPVFSQSAAWGPFLDSSHDLKPWHCPYMNPLLPRSWLHYDYT